MMDYRRCIGNSSVFFRWEHTVTSSLPIAPMVFPRVISFSSLRPFVGETDSSEALSYAEPSIARIRGRCRGACLTHCVAALGQPVEIHRKHTVVDSVTPRLSRRPCPLETDLLENGIHSPCRVLARLEIQEVVAC